MPEVDSCGVLFRAYEKKLENVSTAVGRVMAAVEQATKCDFGLVVVLVASDKDCGQTAPRLRQELRERGHTSVRVLECVGDPNSAVLNRGMIEIGSAELEYGFVVSNKAASMLIPENVEKMLRGLEEAKCSGLAFGALRESVLEGRLSNTFAAWHIRSLFEAGGFSSKIGVEEIAPMVRMLRTYPHCIAPVLPMFEDEEAPEHHQTVMDTELPRQQEEAARAGGTLGELAEGILPGYPK